MADWQKLADSVYGGKKDDVASLVQAAVDEGNSPADILDKGLVSGMNHVGQDFKNNVIYVPEVLIAARAMKAGMEILKPLLADSKVEPKGRVVIGTVKGDLHDIGKNLVGMMLEGAGYEVHDMGVDVSPQKFIEKVQEVSADAVGMSALLTTTMLAMRDTVQAFEQAGMRDKVKLMVGGAPVTQKWCDEIGADGYAPDAASAVDLVQQVMQ